MTNHSEPEVCRHCGGDSQVIDSRPRAFSRWRVRRCRNCQASWETFESRIDPEDIPPKLADLLSA